MFITFKFHHIVYALYKKNSRLQQREISRQILDKKINLIHLVDYFSYQSKRLMSRKTPTRFV